MSCARPQAPATLVELFTRAVGLAPGAPAVEDGPARLDYAELSRRADRLAATLSASAGIGPEDRVAVCMPRGADAVIAVLAVLRAGAAYLPVDDGYPVARRDRMLVGGGTRLVLVGPGGAAALAHLGLPVLETGPGAAVPDGPLPPPPRPENAACVLFTSGSTGDPKAVVLEHRQMANFALAPELPPLVRGDRTAQSSSISFDTFTFELWRSLAGVAEVVVVGSFPDLVATDVDRELRRRRVTAMLAPAVVLNTIVRADREAFSALRLLCSGGDVLLPGTARELLAGGFRGQLFNLYGPTEATVACSGYRIAAPPGEGEPVPIGPALGGARLYVVDERLQRVPDGSVGELYVGGPGVGRGYLGEPSATASRFVADPFAGDGTRMYRTGDRARWVAGAGLEFGGRVDSQLKIGGQRVEPAEVEQWLRRSPDVAEAVVTGEGEPGQRRLVAFLVPAGGPPALRRLRRFLGEHLPAAMVPAEFVVVGAIPADAHGKRDWAALFQERLDHARRRATFVAPRTATEAFVASLWEDALAVEGVGAEDDFFALGGHSLLAVRIRGALQRRFGVSIAPEALFENSVLADQALLVDELRQEVVAR